MPHYERYAPKAFALQPSEYLSAGGPELVDAAAAVRETEIEAAGEQTFGIKSGAGEHAESAADDLDEASMDELRLLAAKLNVPNRELLIQRAELVAALRRSR